MSVKGQQCPRCQCALGPNYKISGGGGSKAEKFSFAETPSLTIPKRHK